MEEKLKSILRNPHFILAYKAVFLAGVLVYAMRSGGWWWAVYFIVAGAFYLRPLFNTTLFLPLTLVIAALSIMWQPGAPALQILFAVFYSTLLLIVIGLKNLVLTHRAQWTYGLSAALSYGTTASFFVHAPHGFFWGWWASTIFLFTLIFSAVVPNRRYSILAAVLMGELLWVSSWLPIGVVSSSTLVTLTALFIIDVLRESRMRWGAVILLGGLLGLVFGTSYWHF